MLLFWFLESAVSTRKDSTPLIDQKLNDVDASGKSYLQEQIGHETAPTSTLLQTKDETDTSEQTTASFGDVNISAAVKKTSNCKRSSKI